MTQDGPRSSTEPLNKAEDGRALSGLKARCCLRYDL